jgi:hypothetical protein
MDTAERPASIAGAADPGPAEPTAAPTAADAAAAAPPVGEPLEVASLELSQARSFDRDIGTADRDGDGVVDATSAFSPIQISARLNPGRRLSLDLRSRWDVLFDDISDVTLSGTALSDISQTRMSLVFSNGLGLDATGDARDDGMQLRLTQTLGLLDRRLNLRLDGSYDADPPDGTSHFPEQRWQAEYTTQCCTFFVERLTRDFAASESRRELYFRVDLRGIGRILSSTF